MHCLDDSISTSPDQNSCIPTRYRSFTCRLYHTIIALQVQHTSFTVLATLWIIMDGIVRFVRRLLGKQRQEQLEVPQESQPLLVVRKIPPSRDADIEHLSWAMRSNESINNGLVCKNGLTVPLPPKMMKDLAAHSTTKRIPKQPRVPAKEGNSIDMIDLGPPLLDMEYLRLTRIPETPRITAREDYDLDALELELI